MKLFKLGNAIVYTLGLAVIATTLLMAFKFVTVYLPAILVISGLILLASLIYKMKG